jgi:hypothetical protein
MQANINVRAIAQGCSEYNITVVVKREDCIKALRAVHSRFYLSRTTIAMGIIGPGLIGSTLLEQLSDQVLFFVDNFHHILYQFFLTIFHLYVSMLHTMSYYFWTLNYLDFSYILE